jgi:two-component system OmpR family response regulator
MSTHRILVIEDEANQRAFYTDVLQRAGYEVRSADSGSGALQAWREFDPHLIILDLYLGSQIDGFEVLSSIRSQNDEAAVIILTAYGNEARLVRAFDLGADNFVSKPVSREHLLARVRAQLRLRRDPVRIANGGRFRYGELVIDISVGQLMHRPTLKRRALNDHERKLLAVLLANAGATVAYEDLLRQVFRVDIHAAPTSLKTRTLRNTLFRLRSKLRDCGNGNLLTTVYESGVSLPEPDEVLYEEVAHGVE